VHPLDRLTKHLGGATVWAKREDCNSGLAFGGNKIRKLRYMIPAALSNGPDTLVSIGGVHSNHTRQVAAVAAKVDLKCRLVQQTVGRLGRPEQERLRHPGRVDHRGDQVERLARGDDHRPGLRGQVDGWG
jgi:1-aminocyclopropane-1-carboxylate deaminase/D-cysteine desulfhydrase-like pyridoxal-dependent ACC family enzyme